MKFSFRLESQDSTRPLPSKIIIGQQETETEAHILTKLIGYLLFYRDRIQIEPHLDLDNVHYAPDIVQLDYEMRPRLWVECGECTVTKLDRLAVKVPEAEIWIIKRSSDAAQHLHRAMAKGELRRHRYRLIGLDALMVDEMIELLSTRNQILWVTGHFNPPQIQLDFNGLWFDSEYRIFDF